MYYQKVKFMSFRTVFISEFICIESVNEYLRLLFIIISLISSHWRKCWNCEPVTVKAGFYIPLICVSLTSMHVFIGPTRTS